MNLLPWYQPPRLPQWPKIWFEQNRGVFFAVFCVGLFAFGYECCNFAFSLNEEEAWMLLPQYTKSVHAPNSRWAMYAYDLLLPGMQYPFVSCVLGVLFLSLGYTLYLSSWTNVDWPGKIVFGALAISSPVWAHMQEFSFMSAYVACSMAIAICAYLLAAYGKKRLYSFVLPSILLIFCIFTYQSLILLFISPLAIDMLISGFDKDRLKRVAAIAVTALLSYLILNELFHDIFGIEKNKYLSSMIFWGKINFMESLHRIAYHIGIIFSGTNTTFEYFFLIFIPISILVLGASIKNGTWNDKRRRGILVGLCLSLLIFMALFVLIGSWLSARMMLYLPFLSAGIFFAAYINFNNFIKVIIAAVAFFIVISNAAIDTKLFMLETVVRQRDAMIATRVMDEIYDVAPNYMGKVRSVLFLGAIPPEKTIPHFDTHDQEGFSFSFWSNKYQHKWMLYGFLKSFGVTLPPLAEGEDEASIAEKAGAMPAYPASGCVRIIDKILVVKLSG